MPRRFIAYAATSADGFLARPDGDYAWLEQAAGAPEAYGAAEFFESIDTVVYGRKTWEIAAAAGQAAVPGMRNYLVSSTVTDAPGFEIVRGDVPAFARRLRAESGKDVWLMGGGELYAAFLDAGELDEFYLHVVPILIGEGIPLVAPRHRTVLLALAETRAFPDGVVRMRWTVRRSEGERAAR